MGKRKKPGRKPSDRVRQHVMLDPDNRDLLRARAVAEGRTFSDQLNWAIKQYRILGESQWVDYEMKRAGESSA